jgi:hypothetical protein
VLYKKERWRAEIVNVINQGKSARLDRDVQLKIGQQLRAMYDDLVSQGIPDRFVELLNHLDHKRNDPCPGVTSTAATATE